VIMDSTWQMIEAKDFRIGLNTKKNPMKLKPSELLKCTNANLQEDGTVTKRNGYEKFIATVAPHQIEKFFVYDNKVYISENGTIKYWNGSAWTAVSASYGNDFGATVATDYMFFGDASNENKKWDGTTLTKMGIDKPGSTPSVAVGAAGVLTGDYKYVITFYRSGTYPHESDPCTETATVSPSSQKVDLSSIPTSADSQVTGRKIYRTTAGGSSFLYLATIADNVTTTYTDNTADTSLGSLVSYNNGVMPKVKYMAFAGNRVWGSGNATNPSYVYYSQPSYNVNESAESCNALNFLVFDVGDDDIITGIIQWDNYLAVFKSNKFFLVDTYNFGVQRISGNIGCISPESLVSTPYGIGFWSEQGLMFFDGERVHYIGENIEGDIKKQYQTDLKANVVATYNPSERQLWLALPMTTTSTENNYVYLFSLDRAYQNENGEKRFPVTLYSFNSNVKYVGTIKDSKEKERVIFCGYSGSSNNYIYIHKDTYDDDGNDVLMEVLTGFYSGQSGGQRKMGRRMYVYLKCINNTNIEVGVNSDFLLGGQKSTKSTVGSGTWGSSLWGSFIWGATGTQRIRFDFGKEGSVFSFIFNSRSQEKIELIGFDFLYRLKGFA